ncbi:MAG: cyclic nucleotide-binding domain-containing protein [Candidatus Marinimicrobia bacterium]|nr:cyclic nucleotide-binding domain-containing protein [Candidatus Neomarinimicrobiota bacterium]
MNTKNLKEFTLFQGLSDDELAEFKGVIREITVPSGKNFITEGEIGDSIFLLLDGEVEVNQALTLPMGKGSVDNREKAIIKLSSEIRPMFGEMSLFHDEDRRSASVKALTDCRLAKILKSDLFRICGGHSETGYKIMRNMCGVLCGNLVKANRNVLKLTTAFSLVLER